VSESAETSDVQFPVPPAPESKKRALHWSHLSSLARCGWAFNLGYIQRIKVAPGIALAVGSSVHEVAARNLTAKSLGEPLFPVERIRDETASAFKVQWDKGVALNAAEIALGLELVKGSALDKSIRLSVLHATELAPRFRPAIGGVERQWRIAVDGFDFDLCGTMDLCEDEETIDVTAGDPVVLPSAVWDHKTAAKTPSERSAGVSGQLTMYAMAKRVLDKSLPAKVGLDYAVDLKTPKAVVLESVRTDEHIDALWNRIENAAEIIQKEAFSPIDPTSNYVCDPRYCGYARTNPDTGKPYCKFYADAPVTVALGGKSEETSASPAAKKKAATKGASKNGNASELAL
jgi:hypothetical protein